MCKEERLMEAVEISPEAREFQRAAWSLAKRIRDESTKANYPLDRVNKLVENGQLTVAIIPGPPDDGIGFIGLPAEVGLYLTANACGGLFPQAPE
jgi:hypothetical protein